MAEVQGKSDSSSVVQLFFEGLPEAPLLAGSALLRSLLKKHFQRWPYVERPVGRGRPFFQAESKGRGFQLSTLTGGQESFDTSAELLCDLGIELAEAFIRYNSKLQCLHCSAVALSFDGRERLVIFPHVNRAGKSLLAASFLSLQARLFADDLLAVTEEGGGMAFGLPPRLRLPLPPSACFLTEALKEGAGHGDGRYHFLYADEAIAPFGEMRPIGAIVLPRRRADGEKSGPALHRLSRVSALQCIAYQFQMRDGQAAAVLDLARRLCEQVPLWVLDYDSPEEAASFLVHEKERLFSTALAGEKEAVLDVEFLTDRDRFSARRDTRGRAFPSGRDLRWLRAPGIHMYENETFAYLIPQKQDRIFGVDGIGRAVFALLEEPLSLSEAVVLLAEVFPHTEPERLEADLSMFFQILFKQGLIVRAPC